VSQLGEKAVVISDWRFGVAVLELVWRRDLRFRLVSWIWVSKVARWSCDLGFRVADLDFRIWRLLHVLRIFEAVVYFRSCVL